MEKALEGTKGPLREAQVFSHAFLHPRRNLHGRKLKKSPVEKKGRDKPAEAEKSPNRGSVACSSDLASTPTLKMAMRADETENNVYRKEALIDLPAQDAAEESDTSLENAKAGGCDNSPTLMELAMWDAEVARRQLEVARNVACIYKSLSVLSACKNKAAICKRSGEALETATQSTGGENKTEEKVFLPKMTQTEAFDREPVAVKDTALISDGEENDWLQLAPSRGEKPASGTAGVGAVSNEKLLTDPMDL
ncbi:hypothetical protein TRSC58_02472 [Trypanosoma rangeli SC58]|uniref:Uncharacterized protein n=1 Tax=Trypanosoma rangeli SC58 TaxID=429131 RepID=A0A061J2Y8_TRYRA|nr:hypothetical protein TRSC58_02472 [Trypanosoma rangeli SC58]